MWFKKCVWLPAISLMLLGGVSSSQLLGLMIYVFSSCSTWAALKFYAQWGLLTLVQEHKLPGKPFWKWTPVILLRKGMPLQCWRLGTDSLDFKASTYSSTFVTCVSWHSTLKNTPLFPSTFCNWAADRVLIPVFLIQGTLIPDCT